MAAPTVIDVPIEEVARATVSPVGVLIEYGPLSLQIPAGAVSVDTEIVVTRLSKPFHTQPVEGPIPEGTAAMPVGSIFDFGPAGATFAKPVTITLPYDPGLGPDGPDPARIAVAYWNGEAWTLAGGTVHPEDNTVEVQLQAFNGIALVTVLTAAAVGGGANRAITWWYGDEAIRSDPVADGNAAQWVTPKDPVVQSQAGKAALRNTKTGQSKPLDDPGLASWLGAAASRGEKTCLVYMDKAGNALEGRYATGKGSNWQKPADYFRKGTVELGPASGDCTDTTAAAVSVFIAKGFPAKGVYGYGGGEKSRPHVWGEVVIGGKVYRIDETGYVISPETDRFHYDEYQYVTDPNDPHYKSMWDDTAQEPYDEDWSKPGAFEDFVGTYRGTIPGLLAVAGGKGKADAEWGFLVDNDGTVRGGWDLEWHSARDTASFVGQVTERGEITASGEDKITGSSGKTQSGAFSLSGQISGSVFKGTIRAGSSKVEVQAERR